MNEKEILQFFLSKGYKKHEAIGIMANLKHESGFDHTIYGDGGKAYGLAQWHPDRQQRFAKKFGKSIKNSSILEQLNFIDYELKNHETKAYSLLKKSQGASAATRAFAHYERFAGYDNPTNDKYTTRINYAKGYFNKFQNLKNTPKMNELDPELIGQLGLNQVPQYSGAKDIWSHWKKFQRSREWIKKNRPEQEKAFIKYYSNKGYITRNSDGDADGPFNKLIIDKLEADANKNGGSPKVLRDQYFSIANNLGNLTQGDITYTRKNNNGKEENFFEKKSKIPLSKFSKEEQKAINQMLYNSPNAPKGTTGYDFIPLLKGLEGKLNAGLPQDQKLDLIGNDGKRGKDLALNYNKTLAMGSPNDANGNERFFAKKIYIPSKDDNNKSRTLIPTQNLSSSRTFEYIDPGYDDEETVDDGTYDFDNMNPSDDGSYGIPNAPDFADFTPEEFKYIEQSVKNSPAFEKFKNDSKLSKAEWDKKYQEVLKQEADKYRLQRNDEDLNGFLDEMKTLSSNLPENTNKGYDPTTQKGEGFPFMEAASSLFSILNGNEMADKEIPERTEQVSQTFQNFTADLKKLSEIGLKPEEEAYAKNMLAESTQASLDMIQRASNGNRNLILGNLGRVDYQKQKGLLDLAVADNRAKTEALFKYGEAVKYISDFEANKDIANNERKYQDAMITKQVGGQLAAQGWASLMDNIQYYKENKPGSANAMLKTHYMRKFYDVDPNETDPNNYYHPDQKKKRDANLAQYNQNITTINDTLQSLPKADQQYFQQYVKKNGFNFNDQSNLDFVGYLANNKNPDRGKFDINKAAEAKSSGNYSFLFDNPKTINTASIDSGKTSTAVENQPALSKPSAPETDPNLTSNHSFLNTNYTEESLVNAGIFGDEMIDKYNKNKNYNFL